MKDAYRALTRQEIRDVRAQVEREQRIKLPRHIRVVHTPHKAYPDDYAGWVGRGSTRRGLRGTIHLFLGEPVPLKKEALHHEFTEIAWVVKGKTVLQGHRRAMHDEKRHLARLPYRTPQGRAYRETLPLFHRLERAPRARSVRARVQDGLRGFLRFLGVGR